VADSADSARDGFVQEFYSALNSDDSASLRGLLRTTSEVSLAELEAQIKPEAQAALKTLRGYCTQWDAPPVSARGQSVDHDDDDDDADADAGHPDELAWCRRSSESQHPLPPNPPPPPWSARRVQELRGTLMGAVKEILAKERLAVGHSGATAPPERVPAGSDEDDFADAMSRYLHSCDDLRALRINPAKAIPWGQWPEDTKLANGVITRAKDRTKYVRYVLRVAAKNERSVEQARSWSAWWEQLQVDPSKIVPAPIALTRIAAQLRMEAIRRREETHPATIAGNTAPPSRPPERPIPDAAHDLAARSILAHFLANANTSTMTVDLYRVSGVSERKTEDLLRLMHSRCRRCPSDAAACPDHLGLLMYEPGKTRGWHMATDWGLEVARRQSPPPAASAGSRGTKR
jgi:hypothetical protein